MVETLTPHHTERRPTPQLMEVKLTEARPTVETLTPHHMERRPTLQPQLTEVKLTEARPTVETLTLHHTVRRPTPQPQLTEVKLTEEETTEGNNTVTRHEIQVDYFAKLFEDHQIPKKKTYTPTPTYGGKTYGGRNYG